ncbi:MAG: class I SAM-dependent methyltransferase [Candidatus Doudnabacteria bacterium]
MKNKLFFPKRIPEPTAMGKIESEVFEKMSKENYQRWILPLVDDLERFMDNKNRTILDIGSGPGLLVKEIAIRFKQSKVIGLDNSAVAVKLARKNCIKQRNVSFVVGDATKLQFKSQSFDLVVCKDTLHHFPKVKTCIKEMLRVLKDGGTLYIQDLRRDLPHYLLKQAMPPDTVMKKLQYYSARAAYTKDELKKILKELGVRKLNIQTKKVTPQMAKKYRKLNVDLTRLKQSFITRYVATIKK